MVVRTEICTFSENKIYPGFGIKLITKDGKVLTFSTKKSRTFFMNKTKGHVIRWTIIWRRKNKKMVADKTSKRKRRNKRKIIKDISGLKREDIRRLKDETTEQRLAFREQAIRDIKTKKAKASKSKAGRRKGRK